MSARAMDPRVCQRVRRELKAGERLVWLGCPEPGPFLRAQTSWTEVLLSKRGRPIGMLVSTFEPTIGPQGFRHPTHLFEATSHG